MIHVKAIALVVARLGVEALRLLGVALEALGRGVRRLADKLKGLVDV